MSPNSTKKALQVDLANEATRREVAEGELRLHNRAMEASNDGIVITDSLSSDNPIIYVNQAFIGLTGYSQEELIGKNCRILQGAATDPETVSRLRHAIGAEESIKVVIKNYRKDGQIFWNELSLSPVPDDLGRVTNYIGISVNVTDQFERQNELTRRVEERTAKLQQLNDVLQKENQTRKAIELKLLEHQRLLEFSNYELDQFALIASHDLQEPLRMVSSYVRLIDRRFSSLIGEDGQAFIRFAAEGADRMKVLINALSSYAQLDRQKKAFTEVDLNKVIQDALTDLKLVIKDTSTSVEVAPLHTILGDRSLLTQLFENILNNSVKYRSERPLQINISSQQTDHEYIISIADNGIGIPSRDLERIFLVFRQVERTSRQHGSGIGLAIAKKIAVHHKGRIWAESELGHGAVFHISFPKLISKE